NAAFDFLGDAGAGVRHADDQVARRRVRAAFFRLAANDDGELAPLLSHGVDGVARQVVEHARDLALVETRRSPVQELGRDLVFAPAELARELLFHAPEERRYVHAPDEHAAFAARELEDFALHAGDEIELLANELGVLGALLLLLGAAHHLHVAVDDGHGRFQIVD